MNTKEIAREIKKKMGKVFSESTFYDCIKDYGYLSEEELRHQMDIADVSVNIMEDNRVGGVEPPSPANAGRSRTLYAR